VETVVRTAAADDSVQSVAEAGSFTEAIGDPGNATLDPVSSQLRV